MKLPEKFSELMASRRQFLGLQQRELAEAAKLSPAMVCRLENDIGARLSTEQMQTLSVALRLDFSKIVQTDWDWPVSEAAFRLRGRELAVQYGSSFPPLSTAPPTSFFDHKIETVGGIFGRLARGLELQILARPDARQIQLALRETWCDSALEGFFWLGLAVPGHPARTSLLSVDFRSLPVTCPRGKSYSGDVERLAWHAPGIGLLFPQVTFLLSFLVARVDALVAVGRGRFGVIEIDGKGHISTWDRRREGEIGLPTLRLTPHDLLDRNLARRLTKWSTQVREQ